MPNVRVKLDLAGIRDLKRDPGVAAEIERRGNMILAAARSTAPVGATGDYRDGLRLEMDEHAVSGAVAHIYSTVDYAFAVEAKTGNLARSLDAAGGA